MIEPVREALGLIVGQLEAGRRVDLGTLQRAFRILIFDPLEPIMIPPVLRLVTEEAPGVIIENVHAVPDFVEALRAGTIDLACFAYPVNAPDIVVVPIETVEAVVIARRDHPAIPKTLDVATFASLGHVTLTPEMRALGDIDKDIAAHGLSRRAVYMVNKVWSIAPIVERTDLIGMLPRSFAAEIARNFAIAIHDMPVKLPERAVYMLWHQKSANDPAHRWLRESMLASMREKSQPGGNVTRLEIPRRRSRPAT